MANSFTESLLLRITGVRDTPSRSFGIGKPANWQSVGKISTCSVGELLFPALMPGAEMIRGERVACSYVECFTHKSWSPRCQP